MCYFFSFFPQIIFFTGNGKINIGLRITTDAENTLQFDQRFQMWEASIEIFKTSPLFGTGFNTYKYFSSESLADITQKNPKNYLYTLVGISNKTHQEFLQILAETGIVGFSLFIISLVLLIVYWFKSIFFEKDFSKILFFLFVSSSFIIIVVHSMVSSPSHLMPNSLLAATTLSICLSKYFGNKKIEINSNFFLPLFIVLLALLNAGLMTKYFFLRRLLFTLKISASI